MLRSMILAMAAFASLTAFAAPTCTVRTVHGSDVQALTIDVLSMLGPDENSFNRPLNEAYFFEVGEVSERNGSEVYGLALVPTAVRKTKANECREGTLTVDGQIVGQSIVCKNKSVECDFR